jgi:hypothetical protein
MATPTSAPQQILAEGRYKQAFGSMGNQIVSSLWDYMQTPENKARLVNVLDPLIQHIIKSIFPYIAFSAVLFVLLLVIAVLTLVVTLKATGYNPVTSLVSSLPIIAAVTEPVFAAGAAAATAATAALPVNT